MSSALIVIFMLTITAMMGFLGITEIVAPIANAALLVVPAIFMISLAIGFASRRQSWFRNQRSRVRRGRDGAFGSIDSSAPQRPSYSEAHHRAGSILDALRGSGDRSVNAPTARSPWDGK